MSQRISIVVPALNEADNLTPLAAAIHDAMKGRDYELLIVDDNSKDRTPAVCKELAKSYPLKLLVRSHPCNGLSGAVLHGFEHATGDTLVVMDADLQHPPAKLPELIDALDESPTDFVIGSRYVPGATTGQKWGFFRVLNSKVATWLAAPFANGARDPMSGFFALRRSSYENAQMLTPLGYKIGLELICKCRVQHVREVPIDFATREHGESKLTMKQQFKYLEHLSRLYDYSFPRRSPIAKFLIIISFTWMLAAMAWVGMKSMGVERSWLSSLSYMFVLAVTAIFHSRYVRTQREFLKHHPWKDFLLSSLAELVACMGVSFYLVNRMPNPSDAELFLIPFGVALLMRYFARKELRLDVRGMHTAYANQQRTSSANQSMSPVSAAIIRGVAFNGLQPFKKYPNIAQAAPGEPDDHDGSDPEGQPDKAVMPERQPPALRPTG